MQSPFLGEAESRVDQIQVLRMMEKIDNGAGKSKSKTAGSSTVLQENTLGVISIAVRRRLVEFIRIVTWNQFSTDKQ